MLALRSFSLPRLPLGTFAAVLLGGLGLGGCSTPEQPVGDPGAAPGVSLLETAQPLTGGRVDSLNGIPGHPFGEPLSAFPGLRLCAPDAEGNPRYWYQLEGKKMGGWWAKQDAKKAGSLIAFYSFPKGRFAGFTVLANGVTAPKLLPEAQYLYGPGAEDANGVNWIGAHAEAHYLANKSNGEPALVVRTHDFAKQMAEARAETQQKERAKAQAEVKAENAR